VQDAGCKTCRDQILPVKTGLRPGWRRSFLLDFLARISQNYKV
jgi:hypothetical protein